MGYRHYFYKVKKEDVDKVKNLSLKEVCENFSKKDEYCEWVSIYDVIEQECIFEFGKLYWDDTVERINATGTRLFNDNEVIDYFADNDFFVVGKAGIEKAIEIYIEKINTWLQSLLNEERQAIYKNNRKLALKDLKPEDVNMAEVISSIRSKVFEWNNDWRSVVNLDLNSSDITDSYFYEYQIFNLVHIYKTMDWEKDTILFYGA